MIWLLFLTFVLPGLLVQAWALTRHRNRSVPMSWRVWMDNSEMRKGLTKRGWTLWVRGAWLWFGGMCAFTLLAPYVVEQLCAMGVELLSSGCHLD